MTPEPWMTKAEIAAHFKVSARTVVRQRWPHTKVGSQNRYRVSEVDAHLRGVPPEGGNVVRFPGERTRGAAA